MQMRARLSPWISHAFVALAFSAAHLALRSISLEYWLPHVGLSFACVLLVPRRFWPALIAGSTITAIPSAIACFPQFGPVGAALNLFPYIVFAMFPVVVMRDYLPGQVRGRQALRPMSAVQMVALLGCIAMFSVLVGMDHTLKYAMTITAGQDVHGLLLKWGPRYLLGDVLGCLIVAPLALAVCQATRDAESWAELVKRAASSRLLLEGVVLGVGTLGLLTALGAGVAGDVWRQGARLAMFAPVAWMAIRYGWQGAAVGGTAASVGIMLTLPLQYDADTILAHVVIGITIVILLPVGAVVGRLNELERQASDELANSLQATRRELYQAELRLRTGIQAMDRVHDSLIDTLNRLLRRFRHHMPEEEERRYRLQLVALKHERHWLAQSIHPVQWQTRGLSAALFDGPIAQALTESEIPFYARVPDAANLLSQGAQITLYRLACEAVAYILDRDIAITAMQLRVLVSDSGGGGGKWAALVIEGKGAESTARDRQLPAAAKDYQLSKLGAQGLGLSDMRDRVTFYGGKVRVSRGRNRIVLSLLDAA